MLFKARIHPNWDSNDNRLNAHPRYQMLMDYLEDGQRIKNLFLCMILSQYGAHLWESSSKDVMTANTHVSSMLSINLKQAKLSYLPILSFSGADWET